MFDNLISQRNLDVDSPCWCSTIGKLEEAFAFRTSVKQADITGLVDFVNLHRITKPFYSLYFFDIFRDYVPLYLSLWKMRLKDVSAVDNIHQDGGVYYFAKNGYESRMMTLWTNIYRDQIDGLSDSDMGLFVVDNAHPVNQPLYDRMAAADTHFFVKRKNQLADNSYIGGKPIAWDISTLVKTRFAYQPGTTISFNSHLLHGSTPYSGELARLPDTEANKFRVSLTSVWLHKDDVAWSVVSCPEAEYENLYLSRVDRNMWSDVKRVFDDACKTEATRIASISALIREHLGPALPPVTAT